MAAKNMGRRYELCAVRQQQLPPSKTCDRVYTLGDASFQSLLGINLVPSRYAEQHENGSDFNWKRGVWSAHLPKTYELATES